MHRIFVSTNKGTDNFKQQHHKLLAMTTTAATTAINKVGDIKIVFCEAIGKYHVQQLTATGIWHTYLQFGIGRAATMVTKIKKQAAEKGQSVEEVSK